MSIQNLLEIIKEYAPQDKELIIRAYEFANTVHRGVKRKSGEPYIIHPIAVACILAVMHADVDTICAGLLHDVIEDGENITESTLTDLFNPTIAYLVDGVSKLPKIKHGSKGETEAYNRRKIIESLMVDIRILIIKLADRLHNMRTLQYHTPEKQIENAQETMDIFVPFASLIGAYGIKQELEDLSFKYLNPTKYNEMLALVEESKKENFEVVESALCQIAQLLNSNNVNYEIIMRNKGLYSLYKKMNTYNDITKIHDLTAIDILLEEINDCYLFRDQINAIYPNIPEKAKDYIRNPKANMYSALHTTVVAPNNRMIQFQLNTKKMYLINRYGITAYWDLLKFNHAPEHMQDDVRKMPFFYQLQELAHSDLKNDDFNREVQKEILSETLYLKTPQGEPVELPAGSTPVDFAYYIHADLGNNITAAIVNGKRVPLDYQLQSKDVVQIIFDTNLCGPRLDISSMCTTRRAKKKIKEFNDSFNYTGK